MGQKTSSSTRKSVVADREEVLQAVLYATQDNDVCCDSSHVVSISQDLSTRVELSFTCIGVEKNVHGRILVHTKIGGEYVRNFRLWNSFS
jgi:hypothetical protein